MPHYLRWIKGFLAFRYEMREKRQSGRNDLKDMEVFLERISDNHTEWQVRQAHSAIKLFCIYERQYSVVAKKDKNQSLDNWSKILEKTKA